MSLHDKWFVQRTFPTGYDGTTREGVFDDLAANGVRGVFTGQPPNARPWPETFGYSPLDVSRGILAGIPPDRVAVLEGLPGGPGVADALVRLHYDVVEYRGVRYFSRYQDRQVDLQDPASRIAMHNMNRVLIGDDSVAHTGATALLTAVIDMMADAGPTLGDDVEYHAVALQLGDIVIGNIYVPTLDTREAFMQQANLDTASRARLVSYQRDALPLPSLVGTGIRLDGTDRILTLALSYSSEQDAERARAVISGRVTDFASFSSRQRLSERWTFLGSCLFRTEKGAVSKIELRLKNDYPSSTWTDMWFTGDLEFLIS